MTVLDESRLELMRRRLAAVDTSADPAIAAGADTATNGGDATTPDVLGVSERRMWRIHELDPGSVSHNIGLILTFGDGYDLDTVVTSADRMLGSGPVLASVIAADDALPRRVPRHVDAEWVTPEVLWTWGCADLDDVLAPVASRTGRMPLTEVATQLTRTPFRLTDAPPARAAVCALADGTVAMILVVHHLAVDGTSWPALLGALTTGDTVVPEDAPDTDHPSQSVDEAVGHARITWAAADVRHPFTGALPTVSAPQSWLAPMDDAASVRQRHTLDVDVVAGISEVARDVGATPNAVLISMCALAVHAVSGSDDHVLLVPTDNRRPDQDPRTVGYCGNIVPMRFPLDPTASTRETLRHLTSVIYSAMEFSAVDFGTVLTALRASGGRFPVADVLASVRHSPMRGVPTPRGPVAYESISTGVASYPLGFAFEIDDRDGVHLELDHRTDAFDDDAAERVLAITLRLLETVPTQLDSTLGDLVDDVRADCAVTALPVTPSRFATPGTGWAEVGAGLLRVAADIDHDSFHRAPLPQGLPGEVIDAVTRSLGAPTIPLDGVGESAALAHLGGLLARHGLDLTHPRAAAHLQPPPLTVAVVADALASATNASLDTYDSGPATLAIETWMIRCLADLAGLGPDAGGVFGPGGSYSNLLALLLARDHAGARLGVDTRTHGSAGLTRPAVLCSRVAHFSVHRACAALGLGESAVIPVEVDEHHRMLPAALDAALAEAADRTVIAVVATAGTTDFGTIDPLAEIADIVRRHGTWLHVDAAYGFGSLFSERLRGLVDGIGRADSITLDLHKIGWQPAAASVLLLAHEDRFAAVDRSVAYLNPSDDIEAGYGGLLGQTLQTTRRPDVLKVAATVMAYGRRGLGTMLDRCHDLAIYAEQRVATEPQLELVAPVTLTTVVFRYRCDDLDAVNAELRRRLIRSGAGLIGRTRVRQAGSSEAPICLKLTLLNPEAHDSDIDGLFDDILRTALEVEAEATPSDRRDLEGRP